MHETRFINEIFAVLKREMSGDRAFGKVIVNVRLSPYSHVSAESLKGSFKELSKGEGLSNVRIKVLSLEISLECKTCKRSARITEKVFSCPFCGSANVNIRMEKEFFVESLEVERV